MKLTRKDIVKLARLSRLGLLKGEIETYQKEISAILEYVEQLNSVDVSELAPTYQITGLTSKDVNATRKDEITEQVMQEQLFKNLPFNENGHIKVKRMIG